jgi:hypothetical protein
MQDVDRPLRGGASAYANLFSQPPNRHRACFIAHPE